MARGYNTFRMKARRRELRGGQTLEEGILWEEMRNSKLGAKFRRQYSILSYVVDFYCPKFKLVVEIDGSSHRKTGEHDEYRTRILREYGVRLIRFWGSQVRGDLDSVLDVIRSNLTSSPSPW